MLEEISNEYNTLRENILNTKTIQSCHEYYLIIDDFHNKYKDNDFRDKFKNSLLFTLSKRIHELQQLID
jgi:hypothetical protein